MNVRDTLPLLILAATVLPLRTAGGDPRPSSQRTTSIELAKKQRNTNISSISTDNEVQWHAGSNYGRLRRLEVASSESDDHKVVLNLIFDSGHKFAIELEGHKRGRIVAQFLAAGGEKKAAQINCKSFEIELEDD
jgi:hypothetical protein